MSRKKAPKADLNRLKLSNSGDARTAKRILERISSGIATGADVAKYKKLTCGVRGRR